MTRVLLVEDSSDILQLLQMQLEWMGYTVDAAADALTALDLARRAAPDIIVSDLRMPDVDGGEFIRRVRRIRKLATVPAIVLTGHSMNEEVELALAAGFNTYLTKPVEATVLSDAITRLAGKAMKQAS
jgi:CheY-like chemotaxis protein